MSAVLKPEFKYYEEDNISDDLKCSICTDPLFEPVTHSKCGVSFCKKCIITLNKCPACRAAVGISDFIDAAVIIRNFVNSLQVFCPRCNLTFTRETLDTHLKGCPELCRFGCGLKVKPTNREAHESSECTHSTAECVAKDLFCPWKGLSTQRKDHISNCPIVAVSPLILELKERLQNLENKSSEQEQKIYEQMQINLNLQNTISSLMSLVENLIPSTSLNQAAATTPGSALFRENPRPPPSTNSYRSSLSSVNTYSDAFGPIPPLINTNPFGPPAPITSHTTASTSNPFGPPQRPMPFTSTNTTKVSAQPRQISHVPANPFSWPNNSSSNPFK